MGDIFNGKLAGGQHRPDRRFSAWMGSLMTELYGASCCAAGPRQAPQKLDPKPLNPHMKTRHRRGHLRVARWC